MKKSEYVNPFKKCDTFDVIENKLKVYYSNVRVIENHKSRIELLKAQMREFTPFIDGKYNCSDEERLTAEKKCNEISSQILELIRVVNYLEREVFDIKKHIEELAEREQEFLLMRYLSGKSNRAIGYYMFLTEARISQMRVEIINKLHDKIV
jgi:DNA-directed RNA polymerase specialized sigma subunit